MKFLNALKTLKLDNMAESFQNEYSFYLDQKESAIDEKTWYIDS